MYGSSLKSRGKGNGVFSSASSRVPFMRDEVGWDGVSLPFRAQLLEVSKLGERHIHDKFSDRRVKRRQ